MAFTANGADFERQMVFTANGAEFTANGADFELYGIHTKEIAFCNALAYVSSKS